MASVLHWGTLTGSLVAFSGTGLLSTAPGWEAGRDSFCDRTCTVSWMRRLHVGLVLTGLVSSD